MDAVVAHQIAATETYRHRRPTQGRDGRARPLRVDMQVRLSGIAAIADATEHVPGFHDLSCLNGHTASLRCPRTIHADPHSRIT